MNGVSIAEAPKGAPSQIQIYRRLEDLPSGLLEKQRRMPPPRGVLLCPADHFRVVDVKNPFMEGQIGKVDSDAAKRQWLELRAVLERNALDVRQVNPLPECEDMVFAANQTFVGLDSMGRRLCVPSRMRHASRRREVPVFVDWFAEHGYSIVDLAPEGTFFEGGGDAIWHPGCSLIWGGCGPRSDDPVYPRLSQAFEAPVVVLELVTQLFYHLDTCFCPLDQETVLIYPAAFSAKSLELISALFPKVIVAGKKEAEEGMACNAAAFPGRRVVIHRGSETVCERIRQAGFQVDEIDTGEFLKSGGSVFCMKMSFWP